MIPLPAGVAGKDAPKKAPLADELALPGLKSFVLEVTVEEVKLWRRFDCLEGFFGRGVNAFARVGFGNLPETKKTNSSNVWSQSSAHDVRAVHASRVRLREAEAEPARALRSQGEFQVAAINLCAGESARFAAMIGIGTHERSWTLCESFIPIHTYIRDATM